MGHRTIGTAGSTVTFNSGHADRPTDMRPGMEEVLRRGKSELSALVMSVAPHLLRRGEILVQMADAHEYVYLLESGWFSRYRTTSDGRRQIILIFLPGDLCGIKSIFLARQQDAIEALTPASVRRVPHADIASLATENSAVALYLGWRFAQDERRLHNWIVRLGRASGEERLASLLLELRNRLNLLGLCRAGMEYSLPLTLEEIADHIGITRVHVSRILQAFRRHNMVTVRRNEVIFLENVNQLERLAAPVFDETGSLGEDV